ncbi:MAG TPA: hypothetical protein VGD91_00730 [Trebonia sp.]
MWSKGGLSANLAGIDVLRMARTGVAGLSTSDGLALLDRALDAERPLWVHMRVNLTAVTRSNDSIPPLLRGLVRAPARPPAAADTTARSGRPSAVPPGSGSP